MKIAESENVIKSINVIKDECIKHNECKDCLFYDKEYKEESTCLIKSVIIPAEW